MKKLLVLLTSLSLSLCLGDALASSSNDEPELAALVEPQLAASKLEVPSLESLLPKGIRLPECDMEVSVPQEDRTRGVIVAWDKAWLAREWVSTAGDEPVTPSDPDTDADDAASLKRQLGAIVERPLADGGAARSRGGLSERTVFLALDPATTHDRLLEAITVCASREVRAHKIWLVAKTLHGEVGAMPISLPVDRPDIVPSMPSTRVFVTLSAVDAKDKVGRPDLYETSFALREASNADAVVASISVLDGALPVAATFAVVNECRRFGFEVNFLNKYADPERASGSTCVANDALAVFHPPVELRGKAPARVPGKAIFGDPFRNR